MYGRANGPTNRYPTHPCAVEPRASEVSALMVREAYERLGSIEESLWQV